MNERAKDPEVLGQLPLAPLPSSFHEETKIARQIEAENLLALAITEPSKAQDYLAKRAAILENVTEIGCKKTHGYDWTLYKDEDGREVAVPRDSGCVVLKQWGGVRIGNYRPKGPDGVPDPRITTEEKVDKETGEIEEIMIAEIWADGFCAITGQIAEGVYYAVRSSDDFVGRGTFQDLKASCRTGVDAKVVRVLLGLRKVPVERLKDLGVNYHAMHRGRGYGTSAERRARKVSDKGVESRREELRRECLRITSGEKADAVSVLQDITKAASVKKGDGSWTKAFDGFKSVDSMTKDWQFDKAFEALKGHPLYAPPATNGEGTPSS